MDRYWKVIERLTPDLLHHIETYPQFKSHHMAVLFYRHKPVAWATNRPDRTTFDGTPVFSVHAEVEAIRKSCRRHRSKATELLVVRRRKDGTLSDSMCCEQCMEFLAKTGVRKIVFSNALGDLTIQRIPRTETF